jgi:hypothetical protein
MRFIKLTLILLFTVQSVIAADSYKCLESHNTQPLTNSPPQQFEESKFEEVEYEESNVCEGTKSLQFAIKVTSEGPSYFQSLEFENYLNKITALLKKLNLFDVTDLDEQEIENIKNNNKQAYELHCHVSLLSFLIEMHKDIPQKFLNNIKKQNNVSPNYLLFLAILSKNHEQVLVLLESNDDVDQRGYLNGLLNILRESKESKMTERILKLIENDIKSGKLKFNDKENQIASFSSIMKNFFIKLDISAAKKLNDLLSNYMPTKFYQEIWLDQWNPTLHINAHGVGELNQILNFVYTEIDQDKIFEDVLKRYFLEKILPQEQILIEVKNKRMSYLTAKKLIEQIEDQETQISLMKQLSLLRETQ